MIRVTIELLPAVEGQRQELGRIDISNTGHGGVFTEYLVEGIWKLRNGSELVGHKIVEHFPGDSVIRLVANAAMKLADGKQ